mgnify:CR=1 FL=1
MSKKKHLKRLRRDLNAVIKNQAMIYLKLEQVLRVIKNK